MQADPGAVTVQDIQEVVRNNALPEWVGQALTDNAGATSDHAPAAIAPAPADDGEVVTSRDQRMPFEAAEPQATPPAAATAARPPTPPACGALGSSRGTSAPGGGAPTDSSNDASTHSQGSFGTSYAADVDDETKGVIVRAVNGMKAQEAARFKAHLRALQAKWRAAAEKHVGELEAVLGQYQVRCTNNLLSLEPVLGHLQSTERQAGCA